MSDGCTHCQGRRLWVAVDPLTGDCLVTHEGECVAFPTNVAAIQAAKALGHAHPGALRR